MGLDDPVHHAEAEADPLLAALGREEGLEDARQVLRRDTLPVVPDVEPGTAGLVARRDHDAAAAGDRVAGVQDQVDQHLLDLPGVDAHRQRLARQLEAQLHVVPHQPAEQQAARAQHVVQVDVLDPGHLAAGEQQQLAAERRAAADVGLDLAEQAREGRHVLPPAAQQADAAQQGLQQVVEVVRDAARELADRAQLLGLAQQLRRALQLLGAPRHPLLELVVGLLQQLLGALALRDVAGRRHHALDRAVDRELRHQQPVDPDAGGQPELDPMHLAVVKDLLDRRLPQCDQRLGEAQLPVGPAEEGAAGTPVSSSTLEFT